MQTLPLYIPLGFGLITLTTLIFLYQATRSRLILMIGMILLAIQAILGLAGVYTHTSSMPPPALLLVGPSVVGIILLFTLPVGRNMVDSFNQKWFTWLSIVRLPVEFVLLGLSVYKLVPEMITFEGRNFDILSGLSAPLIAYFGYSKMKLSRNFLLMWNFICLALLLNVVIHALLAVPGPLQRIAFDQPNVGVLYFPFVWLPGFVVPSVLLSHLVNVRQLLKGERASSLAMATGKLVP